MKTRNDFIEQIGGVLHVNIHPGQTRALKSKARFPFIIAGSQSGKTCLGPWWLRDEMERRGDGDYLAISSTYDLFKLKMLPELQRVFGVYIPDWEYRASDRVLSNGKSRIILRSADAEGGLEAATAKAAWMDECLSPDTLIDTENGKVSIGEIINNKLDIRVWSFDINKSKWELRQVVRWIKRKQNNNLIRIGNLRITANHKIWTNCGYIKAGIIALAWYTNSRAGVDNYEKDMFGMQKRVSGATEKVLQYKMFVNVADEATRSQGGFISKTKRGLQRPIKEAGYVRERESAFCRCFKKALGTERRGEIESFKGNSIKTIRMCKAGTTLEAWRKRKTAKLEAGEIGKSSWLGERICSSYKKWVASLCLQDRCGRTNFENSYRSWKCSQSTKNPMVQGKWVDISTLFKQNGGDMDGGLSEDGYVYNLEIKGNHNYIANGILVSNCGMDTFKLWAWEAIQRRLSLSGGRALGTTTPYNLGWLKSQVYDRWAAGDTDFEVINFKSVMNPSFPHAEYDRMKHILPAWKFNMFYNGTFERPAGLIYSDFNPNIQKIKPYAIPPEWPRYIGIDFGAVNTALIWIAEDPNTHTYVIYRESLEGNLTTREHALKALLYKSENIVRWIGGSKSELQQRMDWQAEGIPVSESPIIDVEAGIDRVIELFKTVRLSIFDTCTGILDELGMYSRKLDDYGQPTDEIKDKADYHRLDALRYNVSGLGFSEFGGIFL